MKTFKILSVVLITGTCAVGAHAQKQFKYLPQALKETPQVSYVLKSPLPSPVQTNISAAVNRAVATRLASTAVVPKTVVPQTNRGVHAGYSLPVGNTFVPIRTPDEWLDIIELWVQTNKRWPSASAEGEEEMYQGAYRAIYHHPKDPASLQLKELKEKMEEREDQTQADPVLNASKAAALVEEQVASPETVTEDYINYLLRFYNHLDPFGTGNIQ